MSDEDTSSVISPVSNFRANLLVFIACSVVFVILAVVVIKPADLDEFAKGVLTTILGVFLSQINNIFSFEFGTTRKSTERNDAVTKALGEK